MAKERIYLQAAFPAPTNIGGENYRVFPIPFDYIPTLADDVIDSDFQRSLTLIGIRTDNGREETIPQTDNNTDVKFLANQNGAGFVNVVDPRRNADDAALNIANGVRIKDSLLTNYSRLIIRRLTDLTDVSLRAINNTTFNVDEVNKRQQTMKLAIEDREGTPGTPGEIGATGAQGPKGDKGDPGTDGTDGTDGRGVQYFKFGSVGLFNSTHQGQTVSLGDFVEIENGDGAGKFGGTEKGIYVSRQNIAPNTTWANLGNNALEHTKGPKGDTGAQGNNGARGEQGPEGAAGQAATITISQTTTVANGAGSNFRETAASTAQNRIYEVEVERGADGAAGESIYKGAHSRTAAYGVGDEVRGDDGNFYKNKVAVAAGSFSELGVWNVGAAVQNNNADYNSINGLCVNSTPVSGRVWTAADVGKTLRVTVAGNSNAARNGVVTLVAENYNSYSDAIKCMWQGGNAALSALLVNGNETFQSGGGTITIEEDVQNAKPQDDVANWQKIGSSSRERTVLFDARTTFAASGGTGVFNAGYNLVLAGNKNFGDWDRLVFVVGYEESEPSPNEDNDYPLGVDADLLRDATSVARIVIGGTDNNGTAIAWGFYNNPQAGETTETSKRVNVSCRAATSVGGLGTVYIKKVIGVKY